MGEPGKAFTTESTEAREVAAEKRPPFVCLCERLQSLRLALVLISLTTAACQAAPSQQPAPEPVPAGDLMTEYRESTAATRRKYDGKEITVRGLTQMSPMMPPPGAEQGLVLLEEKGANPPRRVSCWFSQDQADQFLRIKGGQLITVKGIFNGEAGAELKFCKLVRIEPPSNKD